jgi:hypothetical protein
MTGIIDSFSECLKNLKNISNEIDKIDAKSWDRNTIGAPIDYYSAISGEIDKIAMCLQKLQNSKELQKEVENFHLLYRVEYNVFQAGALVQKELINPLKEKVLKLSGKKEDENFSIRLVEKIWKSLTNDTSSSQIPPSERTPLLRF